MNDVKYTLLLNKSDIVIGKSICYIDLTDNEIEVTKEQYDEIEIPCKVTIENGKVISCTKIEIIYEPIPEQPKEPTIENYLIDLDFRLSIIELGLEA